MTVEKSLYQLVVLSQAMKVHEMNGNGERVWEMKTSPNVCSNDISARSSRSELTPNRSSIGALLRRSSSTPAGFQSQSFSKFKMINRLWTIVRTKRKVFSLAVCLFALVCFFAGYSIKHDKNSSADSLKLTSTGYYHDENHSHQGTDDDYGEYEQPAHAEDQPIERTHPGSLVAIKTTHLSQGQLNEWCKLHTEEEIERRTPELVRRAIRSIVSRSDTCAGLTINEQFILTAAHCLVPSNQYIFPEDSLSAYLVDHELLWRY